ncbi:hypothetical protein P9705_001256 [Enterococcus faecalis]|nr:hypothetical protein [Enterococcus faecalis]
MRKISIKFTETASKTLDKWLIGEYGDINKQDIAQKVGVARATMYRHLKSIASGEKTAEELFTLAEIRVLIECQNEQAEHKKKKEKENELSLATQLAAVNRIRKAKNQEPLTKEEFIDMVTKA